MSQKITRACVLIVCITKIDFADLNFDLSWIFKYNNIRKYYTAVIFFSNSTFVGKTRKERERQREKVGNFGFLVSENIFHDIYIR